jgi:hypothetical protein
MDNWGKWMLVVIGSIMALILLLAGAVPLFQATIEHTQQSTIEDMMAYWLDQGYVAYASPDGTLHVYDIEPNDTCTYDLGSLSKYFRNIYINGELVTTGTVTGDLIPTDNDTYDLGSDTNRWKDLYITEGSIHLGDRVLSDNGTQLKVDDTYLSAPGTPDYVVGVNTATDDVAGDTGYWVKSGATGQLTATADAYAYDDIQAAIDALPACGGIVQLTGGRFYIPGKNAGLQYILLNKSYVIVRGVGKATELYGVAGGDDAVVGIYSAGGTVEQCGIENLTITAAPTSYLCGIGVGQTGAGNILQNSWIKGCWIHDVQWDAAVGGGKGITMAGDQATGNVLGFIIADCVLENNELWGIDTSHASVSGAIQRLKIFNTDITGSVTDDGILLYFAHNTEICDVDVKSNGRYGLLIYTGCLNTKVSNSDFSYNTSHGVFIADTANITTFSNCHSHHNTGDGLYTGGVSGASGVSWTGGSLNDNGAMGVDINNSTDIILSGGVRIEGNVGAAFKTTNVACDKITLSNSTITNNGAGVWLFEGIGAIVEGNQIFSNGNGQAQVTVTVGFLHADINHNRITVATGDCISGYSIANDVRFSDNMLKIGVTRYYDSNSGIAINVADGGTIDHLLYDTPIAASLTGSVAGEIVTITSVDASHLTVAIKKNDGSPGTTQTIYWKASISKGN